MTLAYHPLSALHLVCMGCEPGFVQSAWLLNAQQGLITLLPASQVWVRQTVVENDLNLFKELPTHLRAQVAWRSNKPVLDKIHTFQVCTHNKTHVSLPDVIPSSKGCNVSLVSSTLDETALLRVE